MTRRMFVTGATALLTCAAAGMRLAVSPAREALADPARAYTVRVSKGYLALRTQPAYDASNEIGALHTGDVVEVQDTSDDTYWWVYAPSLGTSGYVNQDYLVGGPVVCDTYMVKVQTGYLALRYAKAYDEANEIGALYTGETVQVRDRSDDTYWYVYAPSLGAYGYVNKDYLR